MKNFYLPLFMIFFLPQTPIAQSIHHQVDSLMLLEKFEEAEQLALSGYENDKSAETICALACVYRNMALNSGITLDLAKMGIKEGETGEYTIESMDDLNSILGTFSTVDRNKFLKAELLYFDIIDQYPNYENAYYNLMNTYLEIADYDLLNNVLDRYYQHFKEAEKTKTILLEYAGQINKKGDYEAALQIYNKILSKYPDYHAARSDIGVIKVNQGKMNDAFQIFNEVYTNDAYDLINLNNLYITSVYIGNFESAYKCKLELSKKDSNNIYHLFDLGFIAYYLERDHIEIFNEYVELKSLKTQNPEKDFWLYVSGLMIEQDYSTPNEKLDNLNFLINQFYKNDIKDLTLITAELIRRDFSSEYALLIKGSVYNQLKYLDKTIECLDEIQALVNDGNELMTKGDLLQHYAHIFFINQKFEDAIPYLKDFREFETDNAFVNHMLAECYLNTGEKSKAIELLTYNSGLENNEQLEVINCSIRLLNELMEKE